MADDGDLDRSSPHDGDGSAPDGEAVPERVEEGADLDTVAAVLEDPYARSILVGTADVSRSAEELIADTDASRTTVYRRLQRLVELDLVAERQELDPDGHHFKTYRARLDRVTIDLDGDGFEITVTRRPVEDDAVDRLNRLHERLTR
ncbi:ArsR family transcriptional regulator [Halorarum halobium]|uniref:ArsR family transcriptional regulator n=1 Tax=Halorarum halobium TaxID=3075121 RepID=UPI0028B1F003|nr:ArsR family transcriptional regulator [Halobaculum sp. XH14]